MGQGAPEVGFAEVRIIILHGWAYDSEKWQPLLGLLNKQGINAELPEIPVLTRKISEPWTIKDYVKWLDELVGTDMVVLIGHSNGGRLALNFAASHPEKVARLVLIDSAGIPRSELSSRLKRAAFKALAKAGKPFIKAPSARRLLYKIARARDYLNAEPVARATMINLLKSDYSLDLEKVRAPVYIIWGRRDAMTPLKDAYAFAKRLPNAYEPFVIEGARHAPQFTHAKDVADYISRITG